MPDFPGRLTVINGQSSLDNDLLVRAGFPDATQAIAAATQFLLKTKGLISGQAIIVRGNRGTFGGLSIIVMTDARPDPLQPFALAMAESISAATTKRRRAGAKKSARDGASKKSAATRKRRATKSSAKK